MSALQEEVMDIRKKLEKMTETGDHTQAMDLLQRLSDIDMNLSILTHTRIGMTVNALRYINVQSYINVYKSQFSKSLLMFQKCNHHENI